MSDNIIRHMVALLATIICALAYFSGYVSASFNGWWTVFGVLVIYGGIYRIIDK